MSKWPMVRLFDVAPSKGGNFGSTPGERVWLLNLDQVESNTGEVLSKQFVDISLVGNSTNAFDEGNVLYSKLRPNLNKVVLPNEKGFCTSELLPLRPDPHLIDREYLAHFLRSPRFVAWAVSRTDGAKMPRVKMDVLRELKIPLPPLTEQRHISATFDRVTSIQKNRRKSISLADKFLESTFLEIFGDPIANSRGWEKLELSEVTKKIGSGATPLGGEAVYLQSGISLIRSLNVHDATFLMKDLAYLNHEQASRLSNVTVNDGDLLLNITGASVARACLVPNNVLPARVNQHVCIIRPTEKLVPEFLEAQILSESVKRKLLEIGESQGATRQAITKAQLEAFKVIVPPKNQQQRFARIVQKCREYKRRVSSFKEEANTLLSSLQQRHFE